MRRTPLWETHPVKGEDQDNMVRVGKGLYAPSTATDLRGLIGRRRVSQCLRVLERMQVTNVPVRDPDSEDFDFLPAFKAHLSCL